MVLKSLTQLPTYIQGWKYTHTYTEICKIEICVQRYISMFSVFLRGTINRPKSVFVLHVFTWYHIETKFISPRTDSSLQIFPNNTFIVKVFICLSFHCNARRSLCLKVALALKWTGDFVSPSHPTRISKWGIVLASYQGRGIPMTLPSSNFHPCL